MDYIVSVHNSLEACGTDELCLYIETMHYGSSGCRALVTPSTTVREVTVDVGMTHWLLYMYM